MVEQREFGLEKIILNVSFISYTTLLLCHIHFLAYKRASCAIVYT